MLHRDKPLGRRAKDNGIVTAPAMWVGMGNLFGREQGTARREQLNHGRIGFEDIHSGEERSSFFELAASVHRAVDLQSIGLSNRVVLVPVTRRGVNTSSALLQRDVVTQNEQ